jgi:aspartyl-tRNA(Asn)/glutamyl-tRNA(Gln) amidotransferase subunit C
MVSHEEIEKIMKLSKLRLSDIEKDKIGKDLNNILNYIDQLNELDLKNVKPLENINDSENIFREDVSEKWLSTEEGLKNAPDKSSRFFKVPKVLDK